jgi:hypothetical protein
MDVDGEVTRNRRNVKVGKGDDGEISLGEMGRRVLVAMRHMRQKKDVKAVTCIEPSWS